MKKHFLIPCFIVAEAETEDEANQMAATYQDMKNGSVLLLDEGLPTLEIVVDKDHEYPHTIKGLFPPADILD